MPETPYHVLERIQEDCEEAEHGENELTRSVLYYFGDMSELEHARREACERWTVAGTPGSNEIFKGENLKGLLLGSLTAISFAFTADDIIDSYSSQLIYRSTDGNGSTAQAITIGLGIWLVLTSIAGSFLIDRFGRRRLIIIGLTGTALSNSIAAAGSALGSVSIVTIGFTLTKTFIGFGAGAPAWFLTSELVSPQVTCVCQSISTGCLLVTTGLSALLFLSLEAWVGGAMAILLLATIPALLSAGVLFGLLPETKERTYEEIREQLGKACFSGLYYHYKHRRPSSKVAIKEGPRYERLLSASSYASYGSTRNFQHSYPNACGKRNRHSSLQTPTEENGHQFDMLAPVYRPHS